MALEPHLLGLALGFAAWEAIDAQVRPRRRVFGGGAALAARAAVFLLLALAWLGLSGRFWFSLAATLVTLAILVVISNLKQRSLYEPLVFSDFAFLEPLLRHPSLFYIERRDALLLAAGVATLAAAITMWTAVEPAMLSLPGRAALVGGEALVLGGLVAACGRGLAWPRALTFADPADARAGVHRFGLSATLPTAWLRWRSERSSPLPAVPAPAAAPGIDAVVVIQSESFMDLRRVGVATDLPEFDRLGGRALARGLLAVPCFGAYTLRPEVSVITGLGRTQQSFDGFHPYLRPGRFAPASLPAQLRKQGWRTVFLHPYDERFFRRNVAIPTLGFETFIGRRDLAAAERCGPYISDAALAAEIEREVGRARADGVPLFLVCVTMEAHDPYGPGRLPGEDDPQRQYLHHMAHADTMLARLTAHLDAGVDQALLAFYGDHAPVLPAVDPIRERRTDFVILECGRQAARQDQAPCPVEWGPERINAFIRDWIGRA